MFDGESQVPSRVPKIGAMGSVMWVAFDAALADLYDSVGQDKGAILAGLRQGLSVKVVDESCSGVDDGSADVGGRTWSGHVVEVDRAQGQSLPDATAGSQQYVHEFLQVPAGGPFAWDTPVGPGDEPTESDCLVDVEVLDLSAVFPR